MVTDPPGSGSPCRRFRVDPPQLLLGDIVGSQLASHFVSRDSCRCRSPVLGWLQEDPDAGAAAFLAGCQRRNRIVSAERTCVRCDGGYSGGEVSWPASWSTPRPEQRYRIPVESRTLIIRQGLKQQQSSQQVFLAVTGYLVRENVSAWGSVETLPRAMPPPRTVGFPFSPQRFRGDFVWPRDAPAQTWSLPSSGQSNKQSPGCVALAGWCPHRGNNSRLSPPKMGIITHSNTI